MEKQGFELCPDMYFHVFFLFVYFRLLFYPACGLQVMVGTVGTRLEMLQGNISYLDLPVLFKVYIQNMKTYVHTTASAYGYS